MDWGDSFQNIRKRRSLCASSIWKRSKFSNCILRWHSGSHAIAWAAITTSVCKVSYDLQIRSGIAIHAFLLLKVESIIIEIFKVIYKGFVLWGRNYTTV